MNISKISFKSKLVIMLLPALLALLYFSVASVLEKYRTMADMEEIQSLTIFAGKLSAVIHEAQMERGISAGFLASKGEKNSSALAAQREATDKKIG